MKKVIISFVSIGILFSCGKTKKEEIVTKTEFHEEVKETRLSVSDAMMENAVIYEANIRQYSEEGSFNAFTKDIPVLKELGVKVLWIMPIYPISTTKSKGSLGSYYAVSDYTKVNPEFGTIEDFRKLVKTAHDNEIYVILDWVANHTGWDHVWIKDHPEYYTKDEDGNITHTVGTDWTDVADLNYDNKEMREQMKKDMQYWIQEEGIDGFRCDVAGMVPVDFWENTVAELKKIKPVFMLAEGWEPELMENAFDMAYGWDTHHKMNDIAQGKANVTEWDKRMIQVDTMYAKDDILMNFTSNHDENSWNGTVEERMGEAKEMLAALTYLAPGMPLIYSGQEYDMNKRLLFFEKDTIPKERKEFFTLYKKLGELKNTNPALHGGKNAASYRRITTSKEDKILAFIREKEENQVAFISNMTKEPVTFKMSLPNLYKNYLTGEVVDGTSKKEYKLDPWQYWILIRK